MSDGITDNFAERGSGKGKLKGEVVGFQHQLEVMAEHPKRVAMQAVLDKELKVLQRQHADGGQDRPPPKTAPGLLSILS